MSQRKLSFFGFKSNPECEKGDEVNKGEKRSDGEPEGKGGGQPKKKVRRFNTDWTKRYAWVRHDSANDVMYCIYCRTYPEIADHKSSLFIGCGSGGTYREDSLHSHDTSAKHIKCTGKWKFEKEGNAPMEKAVEKFKTKLDETSRQRMKALFNTAYYVAKQNVSFASFSGLCDLQEKNGIDMGSMYRNIMGCKQLVSCIADIQQSKMKDEINTARFICVLADGSTDSSITEQETIFLRYVNAEGVPRTQFVDIVPLQCANADGILSSIDKGLNSVGVDTKTLNTKIVACNFDGASVMLGAKGGVAKKIQDRVRHKIITIHCVAHNLELGVMDAVKNVPYIGKFQSTVNEVFNFYHYSPKKRRQMQDIAAVLDESPIMQTGLQKTRWIASRHRALSALEKSFPTVIYHLNHASADAGRADDKAKVKGVVKELCSERFVRFLYFMIDVTNILADLSRQFQNESLIISDVVCKIEMCVLQLEELRHKPGKYGGKLESNFDEEQMALKCGQNLTNTIRISKSSDHCDRMFKSFLHDVIQYISNRFSSLQSPPLSSFQVFDHSLWPKLPELSQFGTEEISEISNFFKPLLTESELEQIPDQWLELKVRLNRKRSIKPVDIYSSLLEAKPKELESVLTLVKIMFTLSPSTAKCERSFSSMKRIKTKLRSSINQRTLVDLMMINNCEESVQSFDPSPAIELFLSSAKTSRHCYSGPSTSSAIASPADEKSNEELDIPDILQSLDSPSEESN